MRMTAKVYFVKDGDSVYDPTIGDYITTPSTRDLQWAHVNDTGEERMGLLYGSIKQSAKTIRLNRDYSKPFDSIEIDGIMYKDILNRKVKNKRTFNVVMK